MNFLSSLGNFSGGAAQGLDQGANIAMKAQQIQQMQQALDEAKKTTAAEAMAFGGLTGGQQGGGAGMAPPGPQPMAPGAPSQPNQPPPAPQQPPLQQSPQAALQPPASPAGGPSPSAAPPPGSQPGGGAPANTSQIDPTDPMAGVKVVEMIARQIKAANPNADPQSLLLATQRVIDMSKGMAPALRSGAQVVVQQLRDAAAGDRNTASNTSRENVAAGHDTTSTANTDKRVAATERGQDIGLTKTGMMVTAAMQRAQYIQGEIGKRFGSGQSMTAQQKAIKERIDTVKAQLTDATKRLGQMKNSVTGAMPSDDDPKVKAINKQIETANKSLDLLGKAANIQPEGAGAPGPAGATARPTATDAKGNKMEYDEAQKKWVPVQNSGATK